MKLTFEIQGYTINIEETEEGVLVSAMQGEEEVESFTLDMDGAQDDDDEFGQDDDDMDGEDLDGAQGAQELPGAQGAQEMPGGEEDFVPPTGEGKLESFMSFIKKRN
jgi:hypothetical protein